MKNIMLVIFFFVIALSPAYGEDYTYYFHNGKNAEAAGNLVLAEKYYRKAIDVDSKRIDALYSLAKLLSWNDQTRKESLSIYKQLYNQNPQNEELVKSYAEVLLWSNYYFDSAQLLNDLLKKSPEDKKLLVMLAQVYLSSGEFEKALMYSDNLLKLDNRNLKALEISANINFWNGNFEKAKLLYAQLNELGYKNEDIIVNQISNLLYLNELSLAENLLEENKSYIKKQQYYQISTELYLLKKDYNQVIELCKQAILIGYKEEKILSRLLYSYLLTKDYDEALNNLEKYKDELKKIDYLKIKAKSNFYSNKDLKTAKQAYEELLIELKDDEITLSEYANVLLALSENVKAKEIFLKIYNINPKNKDVLLKLAQLNIWDKKYDEAQSYLDQLIALDPENTEAYYNKGEIELSKGNFDEAYQFYNRIYGSDIGLKPMIMKRLAELSSYKKELKKAVDLYDNLKETYPEYEMDAILGKAESHIISGSLFKARKIYKEALKKDPKNIKALVGTAHIDNDLHLLLDAVDILEPIAKENKDNNNVLEELARSYTLLGRKDKAVDLLGKQYLEANKNKNMFMKEIYWNNKNSIIPIFNFSKDNGDRNNQLRSQQYGGIVNIYPKKNLRVSSLITFNPYRTVDDIEKATSRDYYLDFEYQVTNRLNLRGNIGIVDFSNENLEVNGGYRLNYRLSDHVILRQSYQRSKVEESFMSVAGLRPQTGIFANRLVGQVTDNLFTFESTFAAPYYKFDFTGNYFLGFKDGVNVPSNFYQGFYANTGFLLLARDTYAPVNTIRLSNSTYFVSYEDNRSGFGRADLNFNPLGSDFGSVNPISSLNVPGTGGYFSPGYSISSLFGFNITGYIKKLRLRYDAGFFAGLQNVKHDSMAFAYEPRILLKFNEFGRIGLNLAYTFNRYGPYNRHNLGAFMIFRF